MNEWVNIDRNRLTSDSYRENHFGVVILYAAHCILRLVDFVPEYQADRLEEKYLNFLDNYDQALETEGGYPDDMYLDDYDPYMYNDEGYY